MIKTHEELLEWGQKEAAIRQSELADIQSADHLKRIQKNVEARRKEAGLSRSDATYAVIEAGRR